MGVKAIVTVTLEIEAHSDWSDTTTMDQIKSQAIEDVQGVLRGICSEHPDIKLRGIVQVNAIHHIMKVTR